MADHYDIGEIKDRLSIAALFERDHHKLRRSGSTLVTHCPFHDEKSPSCTINDDKGTFHCYGCGTGGDIFTYWQDTRGIDFKSALPDLASLAGIGSQEYTPTAAAQKHLRKSSARTPDPLPAPLTGEALQPWLDAVEKLEKSPAQQQRISEWRGYSPELTSWAVSQGIIGITTYYGEDREAFLVECPSPSLTQKPPGDDTEFHQQLIPVSTHIRLSPHSTGNKHPKQSWRFLPSGCGSWPIIAGNPFTASFLFILEGQWDFLALIDLMHWHTSPTWPQSIAVIGLRGATSGDKLIQHYQLREDAIAIAIADADHAGSTWFFKPCRQCLHHQKNHPKNHQQKNNAAQAQSPDCTSCQSRQPAFIEQLNEKISRVYALQPSTPGLDLNDLIKAKKITRADITSFITPKLALNRRKPTGPTFLQWCRANRNHPNPHIAKATHHIVNDSTKPTGRKPHQTWLRHWQDSPLTQPELIPHLNTAWDTWKQETASLAL